MRNLHVSDRESSSIVSACFHVVILVSVFHNLDTHIAFRIDPQTQHEERNPGVAAEDVQGSDGR